MPSPGIEPRLQIPETCVISISPRGHKQYLPPITLKSCEQREIFREDRLSAITPYRSVIAYGKMHTRGVDSLIFSVCLPEVILGLFRRNVFL